MIRLAQCIVSLRLQLVSNLSWSALCSIHTPLRLARCMDCFPDVGSLAGIGPTTTALMWCSSPSSSIYVLVLSSFFSCAEVYMLY